MSVFRFRKAQRCFQNPVKHLKIEYFAKTVNDIQPLTIFAKLSLLVIWQDSEYAFEFAKYFQKIDDFSLMKRERLVIHIAIYHSPENLH